MSMYINLRENRGAGDHHITKGESEIKIAQENKRLNCTIAKRNVLKLTWNCGSEAVKNRWPNCWLRWPILRACSAIPFSFFRVLNLCIRWPNLTN